jgi:hypothetical protein
MPSLRHVHGRRWRAAAVAAVLAASGLAGAGTASVVTATPAAALSAPGGKTPPVIIAFGASTNALPLKGGSVTLSATVKYTSKCSVYVTPTFMGFTSTRSFSCGSGKLVTPISITPQKDGKLFGFTLVAQGPGGVTDSSEVPVAVGIAPPPFAFSPGNLVLPTQGVGIASAPVSVIVTNTSAAPASVGGLAIAGGSASTDFTLGTGNCVGAALSAHETCTFTVSFTPKEAGERNTFVVLSYNAIVRNQEIPETLDLHVGGNAQFAFVALTGPQLTEPRHLQPRLSFGTQAYQVATQSAEQVKLTNAGGVPLVITSAALVSGDIQDFSVQQSCGATIDAGQSCLISAVFTPQQTGTRSALLALNDNAKGGATDIVLIGTGAYATTQLSGQGLTRARPIGFDLNFGSVPVNVTASVVITITNTSRKGVILKFGGDPISGTNPGDFGFQGGNCAAGGAEMFPGSSCQFTITFRPTLPVQRQATLTVQDNTADLGEVFNLTGVGSGTT